MNLDWMNHHKMIDIIEMAAQLILQIYNGTFDIYYKMDNSPLTVADKKANDYICNELKKYYPAIPIISEENSNEDFKKRKNYEFCWLIDPLDGTKEFIKKNGQFTVNIGLVYYGKPVAGFVTIPVTSETYFAIKGKGAYYRKNFGEIIDLKEMRKSYYNDNNKIKVIASNSHLNDQTKNFIKNLGNVELINVGSSIKLLWIAENKAQIYPRIAPTMEWDTCAAHAIVNEVGGVVLQYPDLEEEITYNKENLLNPYFVVQMSTSANTP